MEFSVVELSCGCRSRIRVPVQYACNRAGYVTHEGEGSTGPSRGERRLTVYRAHASGGRVKLDFHVSRLCGRTRPFNRENLAVQTQEFAKNLPEPSLGQQRSSGIGNASSLFLWAEYLAETGPGMHSKKSKIS